MHDVILWAPDFDTQVKKLDTLFQCFTWSGIKLNLSKCAFGQRQLKFLGHIVSAEGCKPDPSNVEEIRDMKVPTKVKEVRHFLGMCGFFGKYIPKFSKIATPLTNLTKINVLFVWIDKCQEAFEILKQCLTQAPTLVRANISQPFVVTTAASKTHVGGVLSQVQSDGTNKAIAYFSKKLKPTDVRYSATDKKALAVFRT